MVSRQMLPKLLVNLKSSSARFEQRTQKTWWIDVRAASFRTVARRGFELASAARTGAKLSALTPQTNCV